MTYRTADAGALIADIRDHARKHLAERLLAHAHPDVRSQLLAGVTSYTKGLNDAQIVALHALLDRATPPRVEGKSAGQT